MNPPTCTLCNKPLVCSPKQPAHEIAWRICAECSHELEVWEFQSKLMSYNLPRRKEVTH